MRFRQTLAPPDRLVWYVAGTLKLAGGGERIIMECLHFFESLGWKATLLLGSKMPNQRALFDGLYQPTVKVMDELADYDASIRPTLWQKVIRRLRRSRILSEFTADPKTVVFATSPDDCRMLWAAGLLSLRRPRTKVTFIHGSPFQFQEDLQKYALAYRRAFQIIRQADPVYSEEIPPHPPHIPFRARLRLEWTALINRVALRSSAYVVVHSEKNRREVELMYRHRRIAVVPAGGFSRAELASNSFKDMKPSVDASNRPLVLSLCRLVAKKRVDLTIRAFGEMIRQNPEGQPLLVIGGTGPVEDNLRQLCRELQIEGSVCFIGYVSEANLKNWYRSCDAFISTDNADYDLSVMMALPLACKVIVTTQYDFPKCLNRMRRYIHVAAPSISSLAAAMHTAVKSRPGGLQADDVQELEELTWESYFEKLYNLSYRPV